MADLTVKFGAVTDGFMRGAKSVTKGMGGIYRSMTSLKGLIVGGFIGKFGMEILSAGAKMEQTRVAFEVMLKSAEKSKKVISELRGFADITPFRTSEIIKAGRGLMAVVSNYKQLVPIIRKLGDISAGTGKDLNELVAIYNKVGLTGKMQARELRQLSIANIPIVKLLGERYKRTGQQIFKMGEQGRLSFDDMKWAIDELTKKGGKFGGLMEKQAQTLGGRWSTFQGVVENTFADLGEGAKPLGRAVEQMTRAVRALREWDSLFKSIENTSRNVANIVEAIGSKGGTKSIAGGFETTGIDTFVDAISKSAPVDIPFLGKSEMNPFASLAADIPLLGKTELNPLSLIPSGLKAAGFGAQAKMQSLNTPEKRAELARANFDIRSQELLSGQSSNVESLLREIAEQGRNQQKPSGY